VEKDGPNGEVQSKVLPRAVGNHHQEGKNISM